MRHTSPAPPIEPGADQNVSAFFPRESSAPRVAGTTYRLSVCVVVLGGGGWCGTGVDPLPPAWPRALARLVPSFGPIIYVDDRVCGTAEANDDEILAAQPWWR